ncbi:cupin domain-containing protein [Sphaerimonospora thailandensis]|uniref:(S)-ureidoglycine aminohydrolase cupin domain-containing protein n=1 Tax=Sphaerimonospora thailandensis TaxID=795644 RepID=A0A8J3R4P7_9ACTN|nr:cupin domain-containing protein [Sphaerimonospora thailandensis]GIH67904.1 hypothetical protein Mth01_01570 [Sphaerimonospora thailandensis]
MNATGTQMSGDRLLNVDLFAGPLLDDEPSDAEPRTVTTPMTAFKDIEVGVWDIARGTATDTEVDEIFLVLAGAGRVTFEDGSSIDLRPGVLVRLMAGDRTTWVIDEPLRKLYLA